MNLTGKKLAILGATVETAYMVKKAEELGIETYVIDPYDGSYAKQYSSHPVKMDCFDIDNVCKLIDDHQIDGILPGCADMLVSVYEKICKRTEKCCYVNDKLVEVFNDKGCLKNALKNIGLPVVNEFEAEEIKLDNFDKYPIFIKPTDNCSSRGMSVVYDKTDVDMAYEKALMNSRSGKVLIEEYKVCDDFFLGYLVQDGEVTVTFTADRFVNREQKGYGTITNALIYPSKYTELYFQNVHEKMVRLFKDLNFNNGIASIQGFVEDGEIMFYDPALRITGGQEYILIEEICGVDIIKSLINFAITGKMDSINLLEKCDSLFYGKFACNLVFSVKPGKIKYIEGGLYAKNKEGVLNVTQEHFEGDLIDKPGTAQQNIFRIHLLANSKEELREIIDDLQSNIVAYDEEGNNMMLKGMDSGLWIENFHIH